MSERESERWTYSMLLDEVVDGDEVPPKVLRGHLALHVPNPALNVLHCSQELLLLPCLL